MKNYSTYIFDLDGTITDTTSAWLDIFHDSLLHIGITPPSKKILAKHTHNAKEMLQPDLPEEKFNEFEDVIATLATERLSSSPLHAGVYDFLRHLQLQKKHTAIVSSTKRINLDPVIKYHVLDSVIPVVVGGDDVPLRKPHPDGILKALVDLGISKDEYRHAVYLGDKDTDIQAAHNAGIESILYYPEVHQEMYDLEELKKHKPTHIITSWSELL